MLTELSMCYRLAVDAEGTKYVLSTGSRCWGN